MRLVIEQRNTIGGEAWTLVVENLCETLQVIRDLTCDDEVYEYLADRIHSYARETVLLAALPADDESWTGPRDQRAVAALQGQWLAWQSTAIDTTQC